MSLFHRHFHLYLDIRYVCKTLFDLMSVWKYNYVYIKINKWPVKPAYGLVKHSRRYDEHRMSARNSLTMFSLY